MTVITRRPENRLAKAVWTPGGKTIAQALDDAQSELEVLCGESLDVLRGKVEALQALGREKQAAASIDDIQTLYNLSSEVLDIAGLFGMDELGQAAFSLCELLDFLASHRAWNWPAVQVHLHGLLMLADPAKTTPASRAAMVEGLRQVCARIAR